MEIEENRLSQQVNKKKMQGQIKKECLKRKSCRINSIYFKNESLNKQKPKYRFSKPKLFEKLRDQIQMENIRKDLDQNFQLNSLQKQKQRSSKLKDSWSRSANTSQYINKSSQIGQIPRKQKFRKKFSPITINTVQSQKIYDNILYELDKCEISILQQFYDKLNQQVQELNKSHIISLKQFFNVAYKNLKQQIFKILSFLHFEQQLLNNKQQIQLQLSNKSQCLKDINQILNFDKYLQKHIEDTKSIFEFLKTKIGYNQLSSQNQSQSKKDNLIKQLKNKLNQKQNEMLNFYQNYLKLKDKYQHLNELNNIQLKKTTSQKQQQNKFIPIENSKNYQKDQMHQQLSLKKSKELQKKSGKKQKSSQKPKLRVSKVFSNKSNNVSNSNSALLSRFYKFKIGNDTSNF